MGRFIRVSASLLLLSACQPSVDAGQWEMTLRVEGDGRPAANRPEKYCVDGDDGAARLVDILWRVESSATDTMQDCELRRSSYRGDRISALAICTGRTTVYFGPPTVSEVTLDGTFAKTRLEGRFSVREGGEIPKSRWGRMTARRIGECP